MGLFDKWKKGASDSPAQINNAQNSNMASYESAIALLNSSEMEDRYRGRRMMTSLAWDSGKNDPRVCMWMAKDYEKNGCPSAAANWYLKAFQCGATEAEADYQRCYNPFHIDEYYAIDGERGCGTPHLRYSEDMKERQKKAFDECVQKLKGNPSNDEIKQCIGTMQELASAQGGYALAMQWMGEYCSFVLHDGRTSEKWMNKAVKAGISGRDILRTVFFDDAIVERLGGNQTKKDKDKIYAKYRSLARENKLLAGDKALFVREIFQPKQFCDSAFDYCNKQYVDNEAEKMCFEYCMTAYYGAICTAVLWLKDPDYITDSTWECLYKVINVEYTDANAERLMGIKKGEERAESIYAIIHEYAYSVIPIILQNGNGREFSRCAMEFAYRLGLLVAEKELSISTDYPVSEEILNEEKAKKVQEGSTEKDIKSPQLFFAQCTFGFQKAAMTLGATKSGIKFIPELLPYGEKTILAFLRDSYFKNACGDDTRAYYYLIMSLSIQAGMVYTAMWHENFAGLPDYVEEIIAAGPADDANVLLTRYFPESISTDQGNPFFQKIYSLLLEYHEPYWKLEDPREYTFYAMLAAYRLGVSMMLDKYGYK